MEKKDFLRSGLQDNSFDWGITNPPFKIAEDFIFESLRVARVGVAMLVRTVFIESVGRYDRLFSQNPPTYFAQYVERVAMVKGEAQIIIGEWRKHYNTKRPAQRV